MKAWLNDYQSYLRSNISRKCVNLTSNYKINFIRISSIQHKSLYLYKVMFVDSSSQLDLLEHDILSLSSTTTVIKYRYHQLNLRLSSSLCSNNSRLMQKKWPTNSWLSKHIRALNITTNYLQTFLFKRAFFVKKTQPYTL